MINGEYIKSKVVRKLKEVYYDIPVYKEKVRQGMKLPCFFVTQINLTQRKQMRDDVIRIYDLDVRYHPKGENAYEECQEVGNNLLGEFVYVDDLLVYESDMQIIDDILHFFVSFKVHCKKINNDTVMEDLTVNEEVM